MSRKLLNRFRCSNQNSAPKSQILLRAKFAHFLGRALLAALSRGRAGAPPRGWWPGGRASVSEAGGPGLGSSLARALRCVSARSESLLFYSLYFLRVSKSVLLLESKFGLMGAFVTFWDARRPTCWPTPGRGPHRQPGRRQPPGVADAAWQPAVPAQPHEGSLGALPLPLGPSGRSRLGSSRARLFFWP